MGEAKRKEDRRAEILREHPVCCYCGGARLAETIDHAPPRICFKGKVGPEGYELPACLACNNDISLSEMVAAFYIRMADDTPENFDDADIQRLISAIANNAPSCLPNPRLSSAEKRRTLRERGLALPAGALLADAPIAGIPDAVQAHMSLFARKMLAALFYRETGRILGDEHRLILQWAQRGSPAAEVSLQCATAWFGRMRTGRRQKADLGTQFAYRFGYHENHGFFGLWMEFGSLCFFTVAGPADQLASLGPDAFVEPWAPLYMLAQAAKAST